MVFCDLFWPFHSLGSASASAAGVVAAVVASEPSEVGSSAVAAVAAAGILCPWRRRWMSSDGGSSKAVEWG